MQTLAQEPGEEMMVTIPPAVVIQWGEKQIGRLEVLQLLLTIVSPGEGVAYGTAQEIDNGSLQEKILNIVRLLLHNFFGEVVEDVAVASCKLVYEVGYVRLRLQGERHQLYGGDPTLSTLLERCYVIGRKLQAHHEIGRAHV